jgi:hypothetical protein
MIICLKSTCDAREWLTDTKVGGRKAMVTMVKTSRYWLICVLLIASLTDWALKSYES